MFEKNKNNIADTIKTLIYTENQNLFNLIDFEDDFIYLEPMLFAYFNSDENSRQKLPIEQLLYSYMKYDAQNKGVKVKSDTKGNIYIPNIGNFSIKTKNKELILRKDNIEYTLLTGSGKTKFSFTPCSKISKFNVEIIERNNALLANSFRTNDMNIVSNVRIKESTNKHLENINKAFYFIGVECPKVANNISKSLRKVVIFNSQELNSFASFSFHGIAFLNASSSDYDEVFFIDDISHQAGHVFFNMETYDKESYFKVNPNSTVMSLDGNFKNDERSIYVVFHALFTYTQILNTLHTYYSKKCGNKKQLREVIGRICFYLSKFKKDIECFSIITKCDSPETILTKKSTEVFNEFREIFDSHIKKWDKYFNKVSLSKQPYNFDYKIFNIENKNIEI